MRHGPARDLVRCCVGALLTLALAAGVARGDEQPQVLAGKDGKHRLRVPAAWKVEPSDAPGTQLAWRCELEGLERYVTLALFDLTGVELSPLVQAYVERPYKVEEYEAERSEVRGEPLPHLIVFGKKGSADWVAMFAYRRILGHGIHLRMGVEASAFHRVYPSFIRIAQSIEADVEKWPATPEGYKVKKKKDLLFHVHPDVGSKPLQRLMRFVGDVERQFEDFHGRIERSKEEPTTIIVHRYAGDAKELHAEAAKAEHGAYADALARRVYAVPLPDKPGSAHGTLARELTDLFLRERYAAYLPNWVHVGEGWRARSRAVTEGKGPVVTDGWHTHHQRIETRLGDLETIEEDWGLYVEHARTYAFLFHHGPAKYRKAYRAYLLDADRTGDAEGAFKANLASFDGYDMIRDAEKCVREKAQVVATD
jgi:hypothetical protein